MQRRLLWFAVAAVAACTHSRPGPGAPAAPAGDAAAAEEARAEARRISAEYLDRLFAFSPEEATVLGWRQADHGAVRDRSLEALAAYERDVDRLVDAARRVDPELLRGTPEWVSHGIVLDALESSQAMRACRPELWPVSSMTGWQTEFSRLAEAQPLGTPARADAAARRLSGLARQLDVEIAVLREGMRLRYVSTRENVQRSIGEISALLDTPPDGWPMIEPARRSGDQALADRLARIVAEELAPAARRYRDFLATEYLPNARQRIGVSELPDGEACYRAAVRWRTTLDVPPEEIHALGLRTLAEIRAEVRQIGLRSFGTDDVAALFARLAEAPTFASEAEVVGIANTAVTRAAEALPRWFGRIPKAPVSVRPYPPFMAGSSPVARYMPTTADGTLRGIYFVNAFEPTKKARLMAETVAFHEALPGHHMQIALALEASHRPEAARYIRNSGFIEGWALYAERLALEMGLFSSDLDRLGLLASEAWRAARLVVDSGIHTMGWSRQQAVEYLRANTIIDAGTAASEVDRYAMWPGQATSYMLGALEIRALRERARAALGERFDVRAFHDVVLEDGGVTLPMLRDKVDAWMRETAR